MAVRHGGRITADRCAQPKNQSFALTKTRLSSDTPAAYRARLSSAPDAPSLLRQGYAASRASSFSARAVYANRPCERRLLRWRIPGLTLLCRLHGATALPERCFEDGLLPTDPEIASAARITECHHHVRFTIQEYGMFLPHSLHFHLTSTLVLQNIVVCHESSQQAVIYNNINTCAT